MSRLVAGLKAVVAILQWLEFNCEWKIVCLLRPHQRHFAPISLRHARTTGLVEPHCSTQSGSPVDNGPITSSVSADAKGGNVCADCCSQELFGVAADIADMYPVCVSARGP
jgi:hypothetical protein